MNKEQKDTSILITLFGGMILTLTIGCIILAKNKKDNSSTQKNTIADTLFNRDERLVKIDKVDISKKGVDFIKDKENFRSNAYQDSAGVWTIGYGHTANVNSGDTITENKAEQLLKEDLEKRVSAIKSTLKENGVNKIEQNVFDMMISHKYNTGSNNSALKYVEYGGNNETLQDWWIKHYITINNGATILQGLVNRRNEESDILRNGY